MNLPNCRVINESPLYNLKKDEVLWSDEDDHKIADVEFSLDAEMCHKWLCALLGAYYNKFLDISILDPAYQGVTVLISGANLA